MSQLHARGTRLYLATGRVAVFVAVANGHPLRLESMHGFELQLHVSFHLIK